MTCALTAAPIVIWTAPAAAAGSCATPGASGAGGTLTGVVNTYYPGVGTANSAATSISVGTSTGAAAPIAAGDLLLVIQMQAADLNTTNTNSYGHGGAAVAPASGLTALNATGLYEYVRATSAVVAGSVGISGLGVGAGLLNSYVTAAATATAGQRTFQVVRVPQYTTATTSSTLTASPWNGSTGGVLALDTTSTLTLNGTVSVDGLGFRGGAGIQRTGGAGANTDVVASAAAGNGGTKGEGVGGTPSQSTASNGYPGGDVDRGAPGNAGGGGTDADPAANDQNTGGGGGGNGGAGGQGGNGWSSGAATGGYGGIALAASSARVFLGGGGGAGTGNNFTGPSSGGASGGGVVLIRAGAVSGAGSITANGAAAYNLTQQDGGGGGGAGGSIVLTSPGGSLTGATLSANGGRGGDAWATQSGAANAHGPGGGGGGGWIFTSSAPTATTVTAGVNGITTTGNLVYGSTSGSIGQTATAAASTIPGVSGGAECADLSITKSGPASVNAGSSISYTLAVANAGPAAAASVSVTDTLPAGVTFVSATGTGWTCTNSGNVSVTCTRPSLASGASAPTITVAVTAPAQGGSAVNTAAVTATTPDPNPANNTSSATTAVVAQADLSIVKSGPATVAAAGSVAYQLVVANAGPSDAASLTVTDTLPSGVTFVSATGTGWTCTNTGNVSVSCTRPALATGTTAPTVTVTVTAPAQGAALSNGASVASTTNDPNAANNSSTASTTVTPSADLALTKTGPATVVGGGSVAYALVAVNIGPSDAANVAVADTLPAGVTFVSASGTGWTCTNVGNVSVSCTRPTLAAGATAPTITITVTAPVQAGSLSNTSSISSTTADPNAANNTSVASTTVTAAANLSMTKTAAATVVAGANLTYSLVVANAGPSDAASLTVTDTLPAGVTFVSAAGTGWICTNSGNVSVSCTRAGLATGATAPTISVVVTAPAQAGSLSNSASVSSTTTDPVPGNNTSTASTTVTASADLSISKSGSATVIAGNNVSYNLVASNAGPSDAANVSVTDTLPAGVSFVSATGTGWTCTNTGNVSVTCTRPTLASGATAPTIALVVTAPGQAGSLTNTASVSSTTADPVAANNTSSATTTVTASADLSMTKTGPPSVTAAGSVSYSLVVANNGPSDAANVSVADTLPAGVTFVSATGAGWTCSNVGNTSVTCTRPSLASGATAPTITVVVTAPAQAGSLTNTASVSSTTADPNAANNTSSISTGVTASADLAITKTGPATVVAGNNVTYTLTATNNGPSDAANMSVTDTLPAGVTFVSSSGTGWTCTSSGNVSVTCTRPALAAGGTAPAITVVVTAPAQAAAMTNTASVSSTTGDPTPANNTATANTTVTASADLAITKAGPATVTAGNNVSYSLAATNIGPSDAAGVSVTDTLPAGVTFVSAAGTGWTCTSSGNVSATCTRPALASGATAPTITVIVTAPAQAAALTNTATVSSTTSDPTPGNNTATANTTVTASADLGITKSGPATVVAGKSVTYTLTVTNNGPSDAANVSVTDTLPAGVSFVSATGTGWTCTNSGSVSVTCTRPTLAGGATAPAITVVVTAPAQSAALSNTASVSSTTADPAAGNNTAIANTTVTASADLSMTKTGPPTVSAAGAVTYSLVAVNNGPSDAANVSVTDTLPAGVTFVSAAGSGWTCTNTGNVSVSCTRPALAGGATAPTITLVVTAPAQAASLTNTASIASTTNDPVPGNNTSSVTTAVTASADLAITKTGPATVVAAGSLSYVLTVTNNGPSDAASLSVVDTLPAGVTFVSATGTGWTCTNTANVSVTCDRPALATGASAPGITLVVTAPTQATTLTNSAVVTTATIDPTPGNNTATASTTVTGSADLALTKTGPATVVANTGVSYQLSVVNNGPSDAANLSVLDTLPSGVSFVSAAGTGWTCTNSGNVSVTCTRAALTAGATAPPLTVVLTAPAQATTLTNSATVSAATSDPVGANNTSLSTTTVTASADLSMTKTGPATVTAAGSVTYSLVAANNGPSDASNVTVTDTLPVGVTFVSAAGTGWTCANTGNVSVTCTRPTLTTGTTGPTVTVVVTAPAQSASLTNTSSISSTTADPDATNNTSSSTTAVTASADLSMTKTGPASVTAAGAVTYALVVTNGGPSDAAGVSVTDTLPAGVSFVSAAGSGWTCTNSANVSVTCTRPALVAGATAPTITVIVTAPAQAASLTNTSSVSSTTADPDATNNTSSTTTSVTPSADLSMTKTGPPAVTAGGTVTYTLVVANNGPSDAANLSVADTLPAGVSFVSATGTGWTCTNVGNTSVTCTRAALAAGATAPTITVVVTAPAQAGSLTNTASVSSTTADSNPANNTSSTTTGITASADLAITKSGPATVTANGSVSYSLVVVNNGPSDAAGLSVTDTLPAGVTFGSATGTGWTCTNTGNSSATCTRPALTAGATAPTITVVVTAPAQAATLTNTASVSSTTNDPSAADNTSTATTTVTASADLAVTKSGPATAVAGSGISYSLVVVNNGPSDAAGVSVTDTLPAGVTFGSATGTGWICTNSGNVSATCTRPVLASGATAPTITVVVTAPGQAASLTNTASVSSTTTDPTAGNNTATASTTVTASADLSISKSGPATVTASGSVTYQLVTANGGPSDAVNVSVTDTLPSGVTFGNASGTGWTCTNSGNVSVSCTRPTLAAGTTAPSITVVVTAPAQAAAMTNTASVSSTTADPVLGNNTATASTTVTASADLAISKVGPATAVAGTALSYQLTVTDNGPSDASAVSVLDALPAGVSFVSATGSGWTCTNSGNVSVSCTRPTLATGTTAPTIAIVVTAPAQGGSLTNAATVSSATTDPNPADNTASAITTVTPSADLSITKSGAASVVAGNNVSYQLVVSNAGPSDAASVSVADTLPAGVTFVSASGAGWTCTNTASVSVDCTRPTLATGATAPTISVVVTAPPQAASLTNTAIVSSSTADPNALNNAASATTAVSATADLAITKSGPASVTASGAVTYSVGVVNNGPSDAANVSVTDTLPAGVSFTSASGSGWTCTNTGNVSVTCSRPALATGATAPTITVVVTAPPQAASLNNTASVSSTTNDPAPGNNTASSNTTVTASADLAITKSGPAAVIAGAGLGYQLSVVNNGPSDAANLSVNDTLPAGVTFVSAAGTGWTCTNTGNVSVSCTRPALAAAATAPSITLVVDAPLQAASLTNTASVASTTADPVPGNNTSIATTTVSASADLSMTKTGPPTVTAAGTITYALVGANNGPSDAANVTVTDTLPSGVTFVSATGTGWTCTSSGSVSVTCTRPSLAAGATAPTITVTVTAPAQPTSLTNTASIASTTSDPDPTNNTSSVSTGVTASADLAITKAGPATVTAGGGVSYSLVVVNNGPSDATGVAVTDTLPAGVTFVSATGTGWTCTNTGNVSVSCTRPALVAGATAPSITVVVTAPAQAASLTNTASVASPTADPTPGNNTATATTSVNASADLALTKSGPATVTASGAVTYALIASNNGPSDAANLTVADSLPGGVTFVSATGTGWVCSNAGNVSVTCSRPALAAGATAPAISVVVTAPSQAGSLTNTASVASTTNDPSPANNTDTVGTTVTASSDLALTKTGPATVVAGGTISYALTVTNNGPSDAANVSVTDTLPAGVTFVSATGTGWTCTNTGNVSATCTRSAISAVSTAPTIALVVTAPAQAAVLSNAASVASTTPDPVPGNNTATANTTVTASANLAITKSGPATAVAGSDLTYQLVVVNNGPSGAANLSVGDTLPAGVTFVSASGTGWTCSNSGNLSATCTTAALAAGATAPTITVVVTAPAQGATLTNSSSVSATTADPDLADNTATASTTVIPSADLAITKTGPPSVTAAGVVTYSLSVVNHGPSDSAPVTVSDSLPAGVVFVSATGTGWTCTNTGNISVSCTRPGLATGLTAPAIALVVTAPDQAASLTNTASVSSTTSDPDPTNNTSSVTTGVTGSADVAITKTAPATVLAAGNLSYALVVVNHGPSDASNVAVTDTLPAGVTFISAAGAGWACINTGNVSVSCTVATLAAGATAPTITVVVAAPTQAAFLTNTASVSSTTADPVVGNNTATADTTVTASADLAITKSGPATVVAGGDVSYQLVVGNNGPSDATAVSAQDALPAGVTFVSGSGSGWTCTNSGDTSVTCTRPGLATGTTAPVITVVVTAPAQATSLTDVATVSSATSDPVLANNTSSAATDVTGSADLGLTKNGPASVTAAGSVTYQLVAANAGPSDATSVTVTDTLPAGVTFASATGTGWTCTNVGNASVTCARPLLATGATAPTITVVVTAPAQAAALSNSATLSATTPDPNPANNTATADTTVTPVADLSITKTGPDSSPAGAAMSYQLAVGNDGPSDAVNLSVVDTLPTGVTFVSAAGTGWSCTNAADVSVTCTRPTLLAGTSAPTITVVVTAPGEAATLINTATVASTTGEADLTNNSSSMTTAITPSADLAIVKTGTTNVNALGAVGYQLTVSNLGPSNATSLSVTDTLPAGVTFISASGTGWTCTNNASVSVTCTRPSLAATVTAPTITIAVTAPAATVILVNTATVSSSIPDPDPVNNTDTATTAVGPAADLSLVKTGPVTAPAGSDLTYSLSIANAGPSTAASVSVTDTLPAGTTFVSATGSGWTCTNAGNVSVTCTRPTLLTAAAAPGISVVVTAPAQSASLTNSATVSSATNDPDVTNDTDTAVTAVTAVADLSIDKAGPPSVTASGTVTYQLTVANNGPSDAADVSVTDTLPAGVTFTSASGTGWTCTNTGNLSVTCTRPALAANSAAPAITVIVTAPSQATSLTNSASVASATADPDPTNNSASVSTGVSGSADLTITKSGPATVTAGGTVTYTLQVSNHGPSDATGLLVADTLPAGVTFVAATGTGWTCTNSGNASVSCTAAALVTGATAPAITVVVDAPTQPATLTNTASVSSTTGDPDLTNNTDATTTVVTGVADLAVTKTGPATAAAGSAVSYVVTVTNNGPSGATSVSLTDTLPTGVTYVSATGPGWSCSHVGDVAVTCTRGSIATGTSAPPITVVVQAPDQPGAVTNTATVSAATPDPDPANDTATAVVTVTGSADLALTKAGTANVLAGSDISYRLSVVNHGPSDAATVSVLDSLPDGVTFRSAGGAGWTCTNVGDVSVTCARPALASGATAPLVTVVVSAPATEGPLTNTAAVSAATSDPKLSNNADSFVTVVGPAADLSLGKTGPATATPGGHLTYHLSVLNSGPSVATSVSVTDDLPAGVVFESATGVGWTCTANGNVSVTCSRAALAVGAAAPTVSVMVTAPAHAATLTDVAHLSSALLDPDLSNNTASATTKVGPAADLSVVKTGPPTVQVGGQVVYKLSVANAGPDAASSVQVVDTLPEGVTFVSASGSGWSCTHDGDTTVTCTRASLTVGAAPVITLVVTAPGQPTELDNAAEVDGATYDPLGGNNASSVPTQVLALTAAGGPGGGLSHTGADVAFVVLLGFALVLVGTGVLTGIRRRQVE